MTTSPRTKSIGMVRVLVLTISSNVSSSTSTVVTVSWTSPRTMLRCWSKACSLPRSSRAPRSLTRTLSSSARRTRSSGCATAAGLIAQPGSKENTESQLLRNVQRSALRTVSAATRNVCRAVQESLDADRAQNCRLAGFVLGSRLERC